MHGDHSCIRSRGQANGPGKKTHDSKLIDYFEAWLINTLSEEVG